MNSIDAPVCVVKRFRRHVPAALETPPAPDSQHGLSTGSFELVTGGADSPEALSWPDQDALSSIDPVDLFAAESNQDVAFQPRWTEFGSYDFNYQPGGSLDPLATAGRRSSLFGSSTLAPWQPPQRRTRVFHTPEFQPAALLWKPPPAVRKSRASLESNVPLAVQPQKSASPVTFSSRVMCSDMPVVRTPLSTQLQQGPVPSMHQAWSEAKLALNQQWLDILQEMGCASGLVHSTAMSNHVEEHRLRVLSKFAPTTLQSYFRIWKRWHDFARQLTVCPFQPNAAILADFLAEHAHGPLGVATAYHKGLTWMARYAQLDDLFQALQQSVCKAYLHSAIIREKRESAPLPLSFVFFLEKMVLAKTTSACDVLQLGSLLFLIWSSLRWSDALWVDPQTLTIQQHAMFALASHTKTTNRGMPIACFAFGLLGRHGQVAWAQVWLNVVQQALHDTQQRFPTFKVDFLLTEVGPDMLKPVFLRPMPRDRGLQLLRYWLCKCHEAHQVPAQPSDFHLLGTHSCKTTLLCWAQQLQLPWEQRQLQGHHRSSIHGSVSLYSRDDTLPALVLQGTIAQRIAEGFRPLRPMRRGGSPALPDFAITLPPWQPLHFQVEPQPAVTDPMPERAKEPDAPQAPSDAEDSEASEESAMEEDFPSNIAEKLAEAPEEMVFLVNPITKVAHLAIQCDSLDRARCYEDTTLQAYRTGCGARPNAISGDLQFTHCLPVGARLCLRRACAKIMSHVA